MKKPISSFLIFASLLVGLFSLHIETGFARSYRTKSTDVYVKGYYKKNGTYVQPYYRSKADGITTNNYSCIDYGKCGTSTTKVNSDSTTYSYTIPSYKTPSPKALEKSTTLIEVTKKPTTRSATNNAYYVIGKTSSNCSKIEVTAINTDENIFDVYTLKKYKYGDSTFQYGIREDWNNLGAGLNKYEFKATCDDKNVVTSITLNKN